jgi:hypothetical protein
VRKAQQAVSLGVAADGGLAGRQDADLVVL